MATEVLNNAMLTVDGTDLSSYLNQVTLNYESQTADDTAMGDDTTVNIGTLKNWSIDATFNQDFGASAVDQTLFSLVGSQVTVELQVDKDATVGSDNPKFTGSGLIQSYNPLSGSVGDKISAPLTVQSAGTLSRATT